MRRIDEKTLPCPKLLLKPLEDAVEGKDQRHHFTRHILDRKPCARPARIYLGGLPDDGTEAGKRLPHDTRHREEHRRQNDRQQWNINRIGAGKKRQKRCPDMRGATEHDADGAGLDLHAFDQGHVGNAAAAAHIGIHHQMHVAGKPGIGGRHGAVAHRLAVQRRGHEPERFILRLQSPQRRAFGNNQPVLLIE